MSSEGRCTSDKMEAAGAELDAVRHCKKRALDNRVSIESQYCEGVLPKRRQLQNFSSNSNGSY